MSKNKKHGLVITLSRDYVISLIIQMFILGYALYLDWNFLTLLTLFLIQAIAISLFGLLELNLKARSERTSLASSV